ncbi:radical SAM protein [Clostridium sediminicola]|uniref:radical SAM protein n=1 Tax=Clostridium sediminicola TaxID=3114879 RepID=UPI0031F27E25
MHYTGPVYRHPLEANTLLLQVTSGCSHNKCTFCTMYKDVPFKVDSLEQIESDLIEARQNFRHLNRIFLENADPFVLSAEKLKRIGKLIVKYFPEMETISTYASISNLKNKSVEDLRELKELRFNDLYVGVESGYDDALRFMNKGYSAKDAYEQLKKLNVVGIDFMALLILGVGGKGSSTINTIETAKLMNATNPKMISVIPISIFPGSKLEEKYKAGEFVLPTELEVIEEEKVLIELLDVKNSYFYGLHSNNLVRVSGMLPNDKEKMLEIIDESMLLLDDEELNSKIYRIGL